MPQHTRELVARSARRHLPPHLAPVASSRFNEGLAQYGVTNHLREDVSELCPKCNQRLPLSSPVNYCPVCGADVRPYCAESECAEELLDAHNQAAIAQRRGDWQPWKVEAVAKLCGIGLAILDAPDTQTVHLYLAAISDLPSASLQAGRDAGED